MQDQGGSCPIIWDILIATIPQRHERLRLLLAELARQMMPGVGVRLTISQPVSLGGPSLGAKILRVTRESHADYVCTLDDDDWVAPDYIQRIMAALATGPDYVGFRVEYSVDGELQYPIDHSLRHRAWVGSVARDITDLNPIRREIALKGDYLGSLAGHPPGGHGNDRMWAASIRALNLDMTECYIDAIMYHYRYSRTDNYVTGRRPTTVPVPVMPAYPWLVTTVLP